MPQWRPPPWRCSGARPRDTDSGPRPQARSTRRHPRQTGPANNKRVHVRQERHCLNNVLSPHVSHSVSRWLCMKRSTINKHWTWNVRRLRLNSSPSLAVSPLNAPEEHTIYCLKMHKINDHFCGGPDFIIWSENWFVGMGQSLDCHHSPLRVGAGSWNSGDRTRRPTNGSSISKWPDTNSDSTYSWGPFQHLMVCVCVKRTQ